MPSMRCTSEPGPVASDCGRRAPAPRRATDQGGSMTTETGTTLRPYRLAAGEGRADVWWKTGRVTVKAGGADTGGSFAQLEMNDPRGTAPPMHLHHNADETFYVIEGEIIVL